MSQLYDDITARTVVGGFDGRIVDLPVGKCTAIGQRDLAAEQGGEQLLLAGRDDLPERCTRMNADSEQQNENDRASGESEDGEWTAQGTGLATSGAVPGDHRSTE